RGRPIGSLRRGDCEHPRDVACELLGRDRRVRGCHDADDVPLRRLTEPAGKGRDLGAHASEPVAGRLANDPEGARHQMILRCARKSTTALAASGAGALTTFVAPRCSGLRDPVTFAVAAAPPGVAPSTSRSERARVVISLLRAPMIPLSDG